MIKKIIAGMLFVSIILWYTIIRGPQQSQNAIPTAAQSCPTHDEGMLKFLYNSRIGAAFSYLMTSRAASSAAGFFADTRLSKYYIPYFAQRYGINTHEASKQVGEYRSLNDFFKRTLKPNTRSIDTGLVISPADGALLAFQDLNNTALFTIKSTSFSLNTFLADSTLAQEYRGGTLLIFRLAPGDYHRFHMPMAGTPAAARRIAGRYHSVNPLVFCYGVNPFSDNERRLIAVTVAKPEDNYLIIPVGALGVGRIRETYLPNTFINQGAELGYFEFGGSTVVLVFKKDAIPLRPDILENSQAGRETKVRMGERITIV